MPTTTNFRYACQVLEVDPTEASEALHAAKRAAGLKGSDICEFDVATGDILYNDEPIGNLGD